MRAPGFGGQSKLVVPKDGTGERPLPSHSWPFLRPPEQCPPLVPSLTAPSPTQTGHGTASSIALNTRELRFKRRGERAGLEVRRAAHAYR